MNSIKILVVDDHATVRQGLRSLLSARSHWTVCGEASDGVEAVEKAKTLHPDIILMDISMPRMDGLAATQAIRRESPAAKIIIVSQNDPDVVQKQAKEVGASAYVTKGSMSRDLLPVIEEVLHLNGASAQDGPRAKPQESSLAWIKGSGEMATHMRSTDWSKTPLGPVESWSPTLRVMVNVILANRFPHLLWWGPEFCCIYNDAYISILASKHPSAFGRPVAEVWHEIWDVLRPLIETPYHGGPATWAEDIELTLNRRGYREETHFTIAYSPVPDNTASSGIGGVLATVTEITEQILGQRRMTALRDLGVESAEAESAEDACANAASILAAHNKDVPFVLLYLLDPNTQSARLVGSHGVDLDDPRCPKIFENVNSNSHAWPIAAMIETEKVQFVENLADKFTTVPKSAWDEPAATAAVVPLGSNTAHQFAGFMIAGLSPRLRFDESYGNFLELMSTQIATTIAKARAYEEERKRAEALAEIDRAKTVFFSNISHEFRTPLTLMMGPLEDAIADSKGMSDSDRERLQLAHRNSLRLLKLVNTLLDFSRIEAGRIQASYEPADLSQATAELAGTFRSAIERAGMKLVVDCPPLGEMVYVDREMWEKIVLNLLSNAFKFTFEGEIAVSLRQVGSAAELTVRDTGTGIPLDEIPRLFERFHRVKGARGRSYEGSGIGLAFVQELVKLHGGNVRVESKVDQGSTFIVSIPLGKAHLQADRIRAARALASTGVEGNAHAQEFLSWLPGAHNLADDVTGSPLLELSVPTSNGPQSSKQARILLADDNADMREYVQRLLSAQYEVTAVADGHAALERARQQSPDLILSDIMMPKLDGFGLLQAVRADESLRGVPVIFLSARSGEEARIEGLDSGVDDYLIKPFSARELLARVKSQLALSQIRRESIDLENKLSMDAKLLSAIIASSDDAIISKTLDGIITSWNESAERIFGYTAEEAIGQSITMIIPTERRNEEVEIIARLRRGERVDHFETVRMRKDGSTLDLSLTISPIKDATGKVIGASKVARDITIQRRAEEAIRESEERFRAIVETTPECVKLVTNEGILLHMNSSGLQMVGAQDSDAVVGKSVYQLIAPEDRERFRAFNQRVCAGEKGSLVFDIIGLTGKRLHMETHAAPLHNPDGSVIQLAVTRDVSERKRAEENARQLMETLEGEVHARTIELEKRNTEILRQSDLLREFSRRLMQTQDEERRHIARELHDSAGQTLTILGINLAQLVQKAGRRSPELANDAEKIEDIVQQLHREIRTTSYLLHPPLLDESGLPSALSWYIQGLGERSNLDIQLDIPEEFGRLNRDIELAVFRLVQEALTNIHRHSGSKTAEIKVAREGDMVTVEIQDHGKGMSSEKLAEIQSQGSGVGIRGMRERLRQFGGNMNIMSDSSGTRILVMVPVPKTNPDEQRSETLPTAV